uniref:Saposin B-type domain-containing protein n=1 Tax=Strongyloides papillosus TaxID=174720 RepID=A0A0N5BBJ7_STREA
MNFLHIFVTIIFLLTIVDGKLLPCNACQEIVAVMKGTASAPQEQSFFSKLISKITQFIPKFLTGGKSKDSESGKENDTSKDSESGKDSGSKKSSICDTEIASKHLNGKAICQKLEEDADNIKKMLTEGKSARDVCKDHEFC